jgi:transcriptional regulator with XRE-family HTH domain
MRLLSERVAYLRRVAGLGQREADRLAGLHRGQSGEFERGTRENPRKDSLVKLGALYGAPLAWLLTGEGRAPGARTIKRSVDVARAEHAKAVAA